ncbi:MAG: hypothetical protein CMN32_00020 [Saprospirales bacterium]|nr:hypothetical protein [Saprospirales bacterium]
MKNFHILAIQFLLACIPIHGINGQCAESYLVGNTATPSGTDIGQSITVSTCASGNFTSIRIVTVTNNSDVTLRIYEGDGYNGTLRYTQTGISWTVSNPNSFLISLGGGTGSLAYVSGQTYTFRFTVGGGTFQLMHATMGMYTGGQMYIGTTAQPSLDLNFSVNTDAMILPVELSAFETRLLPEGVKLFWTTASESANAGFQVERSIDAMNWTELTFVQGKGTTTEEQFYQWLDSRPLPGVNYYRLRQVDDDGSYSFSPTRMVHLPTDGTLTMYPNPVASGGPLYIDVPERVGQTELYIYSADGKLLRTFKANAGIRIELTVNFQPGFYLVRSRHAPDWMCRLVVYN